MTALGLLLSLVAATQAADPDAACRPLVDAARAAVPPRTPPPRNAAPAALRVHLENYYGRAPNVIVIALDGKTIYAACEAPGDRQKIALFEGKTGAGTHTLDVLVSYASSGRGRHRTARRFAVRPAVTTAWTIVLGRTDEEQLAIDFERRN